MPIYESYNPITFDILNNEITADCGASINPPKIIITHILFVRNLILDIGYAAKHANNVENIVDPTVVITLFLKNVPIPAFHAAP